MNRMEMYKAIKETSNKISMNHDAIIELNILQSQVDDGCFDGIGWAVCFYTELDCIEEY